MVIGIIEIVGPPTFGLGHHDLKISGPVGRQAKNVSRCPCKPTFHPQTHYQHSHIRASEGLTQKYCISFF